MKDRRIIIAAVCAVVCIGLLYFFSRSSDKKRYHWFESYRAESEQPYGVSFIRKMVESYRPGEKFILNDRQPVRKLLAGIDDHGNTDYIFIGANIFLDNESAFALAKFIEQGGNAFIASLAPPEELLTALYYRECGAPLEYAYQQRQSVRLNFYHRELKTEKGLSYEFRVGTKVVDYAWHHFTKKVFCDSTKTIAALGYHDEDRVNFIRIRAGKGSLYLHSNPLVFTNYFLTDPKKVGYASAVFSHLDGNDIVWDEFSKIPFSGKKVSGLISKD